jgi:HEAT repeat protein
MRSTLVFALFALAPAALLAAQAPAASAPLAELTYSGDQQLLVTLDADIVAAGKDTTKLAALEKRLLADLARRDSTFAARQAIAQRLALVLSTQPDPKSAAHRAFATMLADERDSDVARLALEPFPGVEVDKLLVVALGKTTGRTRLGLLDTLGRRRTVIAVAPLAALLRESDATTAAAAAQALGNIGTPAAVTALRAAPAAVTASAKLIAASHLPSSDAGKLLLEIENDSAAPTPVRHAAFRTSLQLDPLTATQRIIDALSGSDRGRKEVAAEAIATSAAPQLVAALAAQLGTFDPRTQTAVIAALGRRGDAAATPAVLAASKSADAHVRAAAITALGTLPGTAEIITTLARIAAASDSSDEAKLARQSLTRLNGPAVSSTILRQAEQGDAALRPVFIEQLALRNQTEGLPLLLKLRADPAAAVRLAAVAALGDLGDASHQRALLDWSLAAKDEAEQSRALRSLVNVILREPAAETRGELLFNTLANATTDVALRLLPALGRIGGKTSAGVAAQLATRDDAKLAEAAVAALARWTDASALPALATAAETAATPAAKESARAAAIRYFERNREPWTAEFTEVVSRLQKTTTESAERQRLLGFLHRASDPGALALVESLRGDSALAARASIAADVIRANQAGQPRLRASGGMSNLRNMLDGKTSTRWSVPTEGDEWLEMDFHLSRPLQTITLDQTSRGAEFPERFEVHVTDDAQKPGTAVVSGEGQQNKTVIVLPPGTRGRYVIVKNVAPRKDSNWSIVELHVD